MRRGRGKIKGSPHTLPSNIIRLSLMALLYFLPCARLILSVLFHPCPSECTAMCLHTHTHTRTRSQCPSCLPLAQGPVLPLCHPAISPFILCKTSKLPSSTEHEGAALCLMSLLFCCSDLPPPKPHSSAVIRGCCNNGEGL